MKIPKSVFIILTGAVLIGGYLIVSNSPKNPEKQIATSIGHSPNIKISSLAPEQISANNFDEKNNLTRALGQALFEEIQSTNLSNQEENNLSADPDLMSGKLVSNIFKNSQLELNFVSAINDSDLKISQDISKEAKTKYLEAIAEINKRNFAGFDKYYLEIIVDVFQKLDSSSVIQLADIYKNLASNYLNLSVPLDWVDIHKTLIIYVKNAEIVYRAMANYPVDPIKGYLALETVDSLVSNAGEIQNILTEKLKEIGS